jgi:hypothetical protein
MSQEDKPRFSHITVGQAKADDLSYAEDEEVITIGAVDVAADVEVSVSSSASIEDSDDTRDDACDDGISDSIMDEAMDEADLRVGMNKRVEASLADQGLTAPMPLAQKLVLVACLIGLVCIIAFLIWFWAT